MTKRPVVPSLAAWAFVLVASSAGAERITVKGGRLVDPQSGAVATDQVIVVEDGKIKAVGARPRAARGRGRDRPLGRHRAPRPLRLPHAPLRVVPFRGRGLDVLPEPTSRPTPRRRPTAYRALQGAANAASMLEAGFTTVRDVGNAGLYADTDLRRAVEKGLVRGPTIVNAGRIIAPFGGQLRLTPQRGEQAVAEYRFADTPDEMVKAVRENVHFGARVIKVVADDQPYAYSTERHDRLRPGGGAGGREGGRPLHDGGRRAQRGGGGRGLRRARLHHGRRDAGPGQAAAAWSWWARTSPRSCSTPSASASCTAVIVDRLKRAWKAGVTMAYGTDVFQEGGRSRGAWAMSLVRSYAEAGIRRPRSCR